MDWTELGKLAANYGVPVVILFWVLTVGAKNQELMSAKLDKIADALLALSKEVSAACVYMKMKGGA